MLEVIIAALIVVIGIFAAAQISPTTYQGATISKDRLIGLRLARNVIDAVRSAPFGANPSHFEGPVAQVGESLEGRPIALEFQIDKVTVSIPSGADCGTVNVTVSWRQNVNSTGPSRDSLILTGGVSREP
jgi:Tfp pilus assembly protein PilV